MNKKGDSISRQAAIDMVRDVCDAIMSGCDSYYDPETGDEVYKDILEVNAILKCNKEIRIALRNMLSAQPKKVLVAEVKLSKEDIQSAVDEAVARIMVQPERKKGRWNQIISIPNDMYGRYYCSECGKEGNAFWYFCPNCGADMRGEQDE